MSSWKRGLTVCFLLFSAERRPECREVAWQGRLVCPLHQRRLLWRPMEDGQVHSKEEQEDGQQQSGRQQWAKENHLQWRWRQGALTLLKEDYFLNQTKKTIIFIWSISLHLFLLIFNPYLRDCLLQKQPIRWPFIDFENITFIWKPIK